MTRRRFFLAHIRCMTIGAFASLFELFELGFDRHRLRISRPLAVAMTSSTGVDWHVGCQTAAGARACDVDVTRRAFGDVLALTTFVSELGRDAFSPKLRDKPRRGLVAACAIGSNRLLVFPMTAETGIVRARHRLERMQHCRVGVRRRQSNNGQAHVGLMTD